MRYIIGIDEAGRGPLAGPVSVAAVAVRESAYRAILRDFRRVKDSKKLSSRFREEWLQKIKGHESGAVLCAVSLVGNATIDKRGIVGAVNVALKRSLLKIGVKPHEAKVLLDGSLYAPREFENQKTIIRGDEKEKVIAMASILAKVHRDRHMVRKAREYPEYGFEIHKGYGTRKHLKNLKKYGPSDIHRRSFLGGLKK